MVLIVIGLFGLVLVLGLALAKQRNLAPTANVGWSTGYVPAPILDVDDEPTQVRVVGHRLLRQVGGVFVGEPFPLLDGTTIGRDRGCALNLGDPSISSLHAEVGIRGDKATIADRHSTNGTLVNEVRLAPDEEKELHDGDRIQVGAITLTYKSRP